MSDLLKYIPLEKLLFIALPAAIFFIFFIFFLRTGRKRADALGKLSQYVKGTLSKNILFPSFSGEYEGFPFAVTLLSGGEDSPPILNICLIKTSNFQLKVYKESVFSKIGKKLGLVHEIKTGEEAFDREFLVFSNKPNQVMSYLNNPTAKNAIREIFRKGFQSLVIDGKKILVSKPNYNVESDLEPQSILFILQQLTSSAQGL